jgi:hypothetical protein
VSARADLIVERCGKALGGDLEITDSKPGLEQR